MMTSRASQAKRFTIQKDNMMEVCEKDPTVGFELNGALIDCVGKRC